ncbi:uncharacterized protein LOC124285969 [Haliotis rubra]|uniref:uncharacterized protein LOC124285969 n=1 Tax=Haliotis rubra TaxID=36100 RepID=UPI001EE5FB6B|nr:uncharacterized protein LOC124285969 [Haliotis rubra]
MTIRSIHALIFSLCHVLPSNCLVCTDPRDLPQFTDNVTATSEPFRTFKGIGPLQCVKECLLRTHCRNISYNITTATCALHKSDTVITGGEGESELYSDVTSWPQRMAGECAHHDCPLNTICQPHEDKYSCYTPECLPPASVTDSDPLFVENNSLTYPVGEVVEYRCHAGHLPVGKRQCREDETWSPFICRKIQRCVQLSTCNSSYTVDEYWLFKDDDGYSKVKMYCIKGTKNWTQYVSLLDNYTSVMAGPPETCHVQYDSDTVVYGKQTLSKIAANDKEIRQFARRIFHEGDTKYPPLVTGDCSMEKQLCDVGPSFFKLNLTGTGLIVDVVGDWVVSGEGSINVTISEDSRIIEGTCKGRCVLCYLEGNVNLKVDPAYTPPLESAIMPVCDQDL